MRKILSLLLLVMIGLPLASPLLALGQDVDAQVPICCRKNGEHHCRLGSRARLLHSSREFQVSGPQGMCPYCPLAAPATPQTPHATLAAIRSYHSLSTRAEAIAQTESRWRIARDRSRQKRGPPATSLL